MTKWLQFAHIADSARPEIGQNCGRGGT